MKQFLGRKALEKLSRIIKADIRSAISLHNHDTVYAAKTHSHSEYASSNHNHDTAYAAKSHTHSNYASSSHNHDSRYYTETEIDAKLGGLVSAVDDKISVKTTIINADNKIAHFKISTESGYGTSLYSYPSTVKVGSSVTIQSGISHSLAYLNIGSTDTDYAYSFLGKVLYYNESAGSIYGIPLGIRGGGPATCKAFYTLWINTSTSAITLSNTCSFTIHY